MIEKDIKTITKSHKKIEKSIKSVIDWQKQHEKDDNLRQEEVTTIIKNLPSTELITGTITDTIKVVVNGKIDDIKKHLTQQDILQLQMQVDLKNLSDKVIPLDGAKTWIWQFGKIIVYSGTLAAALYGIYKFLQVINLVK